MILFGSYNALWSTQSWCNTFLVWKELVLFQYTTAENELFILLRNSLIKTYFKNTLHTDHFFRCAYFVYMRFFCLLFHILMATYSEHIGPCINVFTSSMIKSSISSPVGRRQAFPSLIKNCPDLACSNPWPYKQNPVICTGITIETDDIDNLDALGEVT